MPKVMYMLLWGIATACVSAAATVEEVAARLETGLQKEVQALSAVKDASTAAAAVQPLRQALQELAALNDLVPENSLWNYIDSTEDVKPRLLRLVQTLAKLYSRLETADFYGCGELRGLLEPQLNRAEAKPADQTSGGLP